MTRDALEARLRATYARVAELTDVGADVPHDMGGGDDPRLPVRRAVWPAIALVVAGVGALALVGARDPGAASNAGLLHAVPTYLPAPPGPTAAGARQLPLGGIVTERGRDELRFGTSTALEVSIVVERATAPGTTFGVPAQVRGGRDAVLVQNSDGAELSWSEPQGLWISVAYTGALGATADAVAELTAVADGLVYVDAAHWDRLVAHDGFLPATEALVVRAIAGDGAEVRLAGDLRRGAMLQIAVAGAATGWTAMPAECRVVDLGRARWLVAGDPDVESARYTIDGITRRVPMEPMLPGASWSIGALGADAPDGGTCEVQR